MFFSHFTHCFPFLPFSLTSLAPALQDLRGSAHFLQLDFHQRSINFVYTCVYSQSHATTSLCREGECTSITHFIKMALSSPHTHGAARKAKNSQPRNCDFTSFTFRTAFGIVACGQCLLRFLFCLGTVLTRDVNSTRSVRSVHHYLAGLYSYFLLDFLCLRGSIPHRLDSTKLEYTYITTKSQTLGKNNETILYNTPSHCTSLPRSLTFHRHYHSPSTSPSSQVPAYVARKTAAHGK